MTSSPTMPRDDEPRPSVMRRALSRILALNRAEPSAPWRDDEPEVSPDEPVAVSSGESEPAEPAEPAAAVPDTLLASSVRPAIPERFGRYVILGKLGEGGLSVVYSAYDPELDRRVAIKILRTRDRSPGGASHARLLREAQAIARLSHPNVIQVFDAGESEGQVFVTMELVRGQTLRAWLRHQEYDYWARSPTDRDAAGSPRLTRRTKALALPQPRPWQETLAVFIEAGRGLAAAHAAGVIHRDFKPDNVMIDRDRRVRVLDFGLARSLRDDDARERVLVGGGAGSDVALDTDLTRTGTILGTPAYMSPEQLEGVPSDARTDQFSYCVALYEAMYGERPFAGDSLRALMAAIVKGPKPPADDAAAPAALWPMLRRGLARAPLMRYPSMDDLLVELESLVRARPRAWARWGRWGVAAAVVGGLLGWALLREGGGTEDLCEREPSQLEGIVTEAPALQARLTAWKAAQRRACEASRLDPAVARCLERQGVELATLARAKDPVERVVEVADRLPPPEACVRLSGRAAVEPPALVEAAVRARIQLALGASTAQRSTEAVRRMLTELESTADDVELAELLLVTAAMDDSDRGTALGTAEDALYRAAERAELAARPDVAARAWLGLAERKRTSDPAAARELLRVALTALVRAGHPPWIMARWHELDAHLAAADGPAGQERAVQALEAQLAALQAVELRRPAEERAVMERLIVRLREANHLGEAERWRERLSQASAEPLP